MPWLLAFALVLTATWSPLSTNDEAELAHLKQSVIANYASLVYANYEDALATARMLETSVNAFVSAPNAEGLLRVRQAWIDARLPYLQTEAFRFYDGPIEGVEGFVNSWPIDENLIDYVVGDAAAGIVNGVAKYPVITADLIASLNEKDGEKNITTGFHAIEFLLWGQDVSDDGPGQRSYRDYVGEVGSPAGRRRDYLRTATNLLVRHLESVSGEWAPEKTANYRARFVAAPSDEALADIFKGIGVLSGSELAGERLTVPYETKEQEDEHSCFSDTTDSDVLQNATGIQNVVLGRYVRLNGQKVSGAGIRDLVARVDPALATTLGLQVEASVAAARAVPHPFDRAIAGGDLAPGRVAVKRLIASLRAQADSIAHAGTALGLKLNF